MRLVLLIAAIVVVVAGWRVWSSRADDPVRVTLGFDEQNGLRGDVPVDVAIDENPPMRLTARCEGEAGQAVTSCRVSLDVTPGTHTFKVRTGSDRGWTPWSVATPITVPASP